MADIELVIKISEEEYARIQSMDWKNGDRIYDEAERAIHYGAQLPKGHGRLKDEDNIVRAIEDRVEFLRRNDAVFMRLRKDIDILGCIPKIRYDVPTIIEADTESEDKERND